MLNNNSVNADIDLDLRTLLIDEEVENIKKENEETKNDLQILKIKIFDLKQMWKAHMQVVSRELSRHVTLHLSVRLTDRPPLWPAHQRNCSHLLASEGQPRRSAGWRRSSSPAGSVRWTASPGCRRARLDWGVLSGRLLSGSLSGCKAIFLQAKSGRHQLHRQDAIVHRLQEELDLQRRKQIEIQTQLRESEMKMSNMEGKLKVSAKISVITNTEKQEVLLI